MLGGIGAKTAALCVTAMCAAGGTLVAVENKPDAKPPVDAASASRSGTWQHVRVERAEDRDNDQLSTAAPAQDLEDANSTGPRHDSKGAPEIAELGIEPQATSRPPTSQSIADSVPRAASASEFGIGP